MILEKIKSYKYQEKAIKFVLKYIKVMDVLLAAAPNAGKTFMASLIIKHLIKEGNRVLCSVHGTNVLKRQFYESICNIVGFEYVSIYDTSDLSLYDPSKPIQVMIYQNTKQIEECVELYGKFNYLVVDEAHKFYNGTDSMDKIKEFVDGNHLLLTGSPAVFKEKVSNNEIKAIYISASLIESTQEGQYDKDIRLDVVSNDIHLTMDDYNQGGEVTEKSQKKLTNNEPLLDSLLIGDFGKTIIYVKSIHQANIIGSYLDNRNIINFTSHSQSDKDSSNIDEFKNNYTGVDNVVLIVVDRATEGFDDPNISIVDITYSKNVDTLYQRYSRAIRSRTDANDKRYVKVVPNNGNSAEVYVHIMTAVLMLLKQEHYENFNGKNFSIPTLKQEVKKPTSGVGLVKSYVPKPNHNTNDINDCNIILKSKQKPQSVKDLVYNNDFVVSVTVDDKVYEIKKEEYNNWVNKLEGKEYIINIKKSNDKIDDCLLMETKLYSGSFFDIKDELYGYITRYATNSLKDVLREINAEQYATDEEHIQFIKDNNITSSKQYKKLYKTSNLKLHSNPWVFYGNGSVKDYFESIWGKKEEYATSEQHIQFIKDNNITSGNQYNLLYKTSDLKLHSQPWRETIYGNGSSKDYFKSIWGGFATAEQHIQFIKDNNVTTNTLYRKLYKTSNLKLHSNPWRLYGNGSPKDYFESIWGEKEEYVTSEQHIQFIKDNNISGSIDYHKLYKTSDLKLYSSPWRLYGNGSQKDYFESIWGKKEEFATAEQHVQFIKDNNITGSNQYAKLYKTSNLKLHSQPWKFNANGSPKDYFESIWGSFATSEEHIQFIKDNNIRSNVLYIKLYKTSDLKLYSSPWLETIYGNGSPKDYFKSIWGKKVSITRDYSPAYLGEFSELNKLWNTSNSNTTHQKLKQDKSEWVKYHKLYSNARKNWNTIPYKEIAKIINNRPEWLVGDFGCGENLLKTEIPNKVLSFDHIAIDDTVTSCDLSNIPLQNEILDVVVFSLSLMGTNYKDYFKEAYRTLKPMGMVIISEPSNRWKDNEDKLKELLIESGFNISGDIKHVDRFIYVIAIKL